MDCFKCPEQEPSLYERTIGNVLFTLLFGPVALYYVITDRNE